MQGGCIRLAQDFWRGVIPDTSIPSSWLRPRSPGRAITGLSHRDYSPHDNPKVSPPSLPYIIALHVFINIRLYIILLV
jgi:hypothetical protein